MALFAILVWEFWPPDLKQDNREDLGMIKKSIILKKKLKKTNRWSSVRTIGRLTPIIFIIFFYFYLFFIFYCNKSPIVLKKKKNKIKQIVISRTINRTIVLNRPNRPIFFSGVIR